MGRASTRVVGGDQEESNGYHQVAGGHRAIRTAVSDLYEHISKEEDGLFPASLTALDGDEWDASITAWHAAHPGRRMISR